MGATGAANNRFSEAGASCHGLLSLRLSEVGWLLIINGLVFESYLSRVFSAASYLDELATLMLAVCALASLLNRRLACKPFLSPWERGSIIALFALVLIGLLGGFISGVQLSAKPVLIDIFACVKFPVALLFGYLVFRDKTRLLALLTCEAKALLLFMIPFAIANQFVDMGMRFDTRYGLHSFQFIFGHPSSLAAVIVGFLVLFLVDAKRNTLWLVFCWIFLTLSLRSTAIAFAAFSLIVWLTSARNGRISAAQVVSFAFVALYFGWSQIQYYFVEIDGSARRMLLNVSFQIADRYFPLGSGFATYASNITGQAEYYSPLYAQYGLSSVQGLTIGSTNFLSDSFWPIVIGQFGYLGLIVYIILLLALFIGCIGRLRGRGASTLPFVMGFSYLMLATMGSSAFFNPIALFIAVCVAIAVSQQLSVSTPRKV